MMNAKSLDSLLGLSRKVVLVAGGGGGIGSAVVDLFSQAGAVVWSADLPGREGPDSAAVRVSCDVSEPGEVTELLQRIGREQQGLDALVHCAGITRDAVFWKMADETWSKVMKVNLDSVFYLLKAAAPLMRRTGGGSIVLVSSITGLRGKFGQANYAASKAGMIGLGKTAALELGHFGIRVNSVAPAWIETSMTEKVPRTIRQRELEDTPLGRLGLPEDVARVVLFLGSDLSRHVNGQVIRVDGGQSMA